MRRTLLLLNTMALSLLLASGVALAAITTFSNTSSISIVDATSEGASPANPYPSEITVQDLSGTITDVNVKLNGYSHPFADDVAVQVVGPDGTSVLLMSDVGGDVGVDSINLTLDDEAANSLFDEGQLTTGTYKPTKGSTTYCPPLTWSCLGNDPVPDIWPTPAPALSVSRSQLSGFDGKDPNGTWKLYVIDDGLFSAGTFAGGWSLELNNTTATNKPQIAITTPPQGATYTKDQAVAANYSCTDVDSGVASCQGTVANGANIDTSSTGTKTFTVNATDNAGLTNSVSHTYTVNAQTPSCTKTGTANAETISGTSGADVICAGGGNDTVKGLGGNDILKGQSGNDKLLGGVGDDTLDGEIGTDTASYSDSLTAVIASLATNSSTGEGSDTFAGVEKLLGSSKADTLTGSGANNTLTGGGGGDTERGGAGNDKIVGSGGADFLYGEDGADAVTSKDGVPGNDSLDGGAGTDTKVTDTTEKSIVGFP
jgi:Ca2+-binding RTX toxin-like protein